MKIIKDALPKDPKGAVLALGNFDGLHLGHREILKQVIKRARELTSASVVYTFDPHPRKVLSPEKCPPLITTLDEKARLIEEAGVDYLILANFTSEFASKHPNEFVKDVLVDSLRIKEAIVGHDYAFGKGKRGTVEHLKTLGKKHGFRVTVVPAYTKGGSAVSSSRVRSLIIEGRMRGASSILGRDYAIKGKVVSGKDLGKTIGFPTANLEVESELIPKNGVYAVRAKVGKETLNGVMNIGLAPTFGGKKVGLEVHLLDFDRDIYGMEITVSFIKRLRGERVFSDISALAERIRKDIELARKVFK